MKSLQRKALTSVIAMLLGLLVTGPIATESSQAAGTITKTVVVRGADNELLPNALVSVGYLDETDPLGWRLTDPVTTNSSGQAIITGLPVIDYGELTVQPAVGDVANSLGFASSSSGTLLDDFNLDVSSIYYIKLAPATVRLNLKYSNGSAAPVRTGVYWPSDSTQNKWFSPNLLREGAFGINIHSSLNCTTNEGNWRIAYRYYSEDSGDVTDNAISMIATNCTSTRTLTLKDIVTNTDHPKDGSVWQVSSRKANFKYTIVSPLDQSRALDYSYNAGLRICPVVSGNTDNCFGVGAEGAVGGPDGTYKLVADAGSSGFASTDFTAIISNNGATVSLKVGYPASGTDVPIVNGRAIFATGVPNLSGRITKPNGDTITLTDNQGFDVQLLKKDEDDNYQGVSGAWSQGVYGFSISQVGEYKIEIRPQGLPQYVATQSPVISVTNSGGIELSWDYGIAATTLSRNIALAVPNVILNILNPKTSAQMTSGWVTIENLDLGDQRIGWYGNLDISSQYPGVAAGKFIDGKYLLTVNPPQGNQAIEGLASKQYVLAVSGSGTAFVMRKGNSSTGETLTAGVFGVFTLTAGAANVVGRFLDSAGQPVVSNRTSWTNVCLQKLQSNGVNWDWLTCTQTSTTGGFSISATEVGTYRVSIEPQGRSDIATTILGNFVLTSENLATLTQDYGNVTAASPTLKIRIREVDGTTNIKNAGLEVRKDNEFITWVNTQQAGVSAVNLANAGTYQFIVNPTSATPNSTRKLYTVTATAGVGGAISASIEGVTPDANGISTLYLGAAQIKGRVLVPVSQGDTATANSWVVAVDKATNQEMWQFGANSSQDGSFAMSLPAGNYTIFARAPYGDVSVGNSDPIGNIAIAADGAVTITGAAASASLTAANFTIRLQNPYWSGKVLPPSDTAGISDARVCLNAVVAGTQFWSCANTDSQGRWAMGKPAGFTDFGLNDQLQIAENQNAQFSMATYTGKTAIEGAGFMHGGAAVNLRLPAPNFRVKIVYGTNSTPAKNLWVNVNSLTGEWLGGSSTDANGFARFRVADLTKGAQVNVDPSNNSEVSAVAASTMKTYQDNQMVSPLVTGAPSTFFDTITLAVPNIRGFVSNPGTTTKVANSWVELIDSNGRWLGGSNTNSDGYFALNAPSNASYRINVNPPWGGNTTATNHSYDVAVNVSGVVTTLTDKTTNLAVETSTVGTGPGYSLTLGTPSVIGKVKDPTGTYVQNSWVVPINASNIQLWELGSNSRGELGSFSMAVPNGSYKIQARAPWNSSTYGPAAGCSVTIANGAVTTTAGGCVQSDRSLILTLRSPNFTVIVKDSSGTPLQNANVGLGIGSWNANAQTDANGLASLFVDPAEINSVNNGKIVGTQNMWMWIDPPYGNSTVVRSQCYSGQAGTACATLGQVTPGDGTFSNPQIVTRLAAPNTSVYVKLPNGSTSAGANAWVTILSIQKNGSGQVIGRNWIAGSNTDSDGKATFNLSDTSTAFAIEIEAPWDQRGLYAGNSFDSNTAGLTFANVNGQNFSLRTPNLTLNAKVSDGSSAISGGWVSVENVNVSDTPTSWVGGYGLDQNGKVSLTLAANGRFKVTINPAPGVVGVATPCIVTTNGSAVVSAVTGAPTCVLASTTLTVKLATGNVVGTVSGPSGAVVGAIVTAKISGSSDTATVQVTSTDKNGTYNLQLDSAQVWDISVTPVNTPSDPVRLQSNAVTSRTITGGVNTINVALIAVV